MVFFAPSANSILVYIVWLTMCIYNIAKRNNVKNKFIASSYCYYIKLLDWIYTAPNKLT